MVGQSELSIGGSRGGTGGTDPPSPEKSKNIVLSSNIGPDPLKITKLPNQHSMSGYHRHTSKTPFKWRFAGGPMIAHLYLHLDPPFPHKLNKMSKLDHL